MDWETLYHKLPVALQNVAVSLEGWRIGRSRYGARFRTFLHEYQGRTSWEPERIWALRDARLRQAIAHAADTVPFYRDWFARAGLRSRDFHGLTDLAQLPVLTKHEVQEATSRFCSEAFPLSSLQMCHTSGSTGAGLRFPATRDFQREQWAVWWRYREWHGLTFGTPCLYFGGRSVVPATQRRPPFWRYNRATRQVFFSGYHLGPQTAEAYLKEMQRSAAPWIHGYPSLVSLIAQYALDARVKLDLRWITTGAESLLPQQKQIIERAFGVRPIEHYGMAEGVANFSLCPRGRLHVDEDFAAVEFLPHETGAFRVVGTSFANPAFPLVRYDTGDLVRLSGEACDCGRPGRVVDEIDGRHEDAVVVKNGSRLGRLDHIFKDCVNVREAQIRQDQAGTMEVCVVKGPRYSDQDERSLVREIRKRVGDQLDFRILYVDQIPRTASGKLRFVVSRIPPTQHETARGCA